MKTAWDSRRSRWSGAASGTRVIGVGSPAGRAGLAVAGRPVAPAGPSVSLLKISAVLIEGPSGSLGSAPERPGEAFEGPNT